MRKRIKGNIRLTSLIDDASAVIEVGKSTELTIGAEGDLLILDKKSNTVSRKHALLKWDGSDEEFHIQDTSTNGTYFDQGTATRLRTNDVYEIGNLQYQFTRIDARSKELDLLICRTCSSALAKYEKKTYQLSKTTGYTIGKEKCAISIPEDWRLDPQHAEIEFTGDDAILKCKNPSK
jgi:hypothetical protein